MAKNEPIEISNENLASLRGVLDDDGNLNTSELNRRKWTIGEIDDKSIFGEDSRKLSAALQEMGVEYFYVAKISDIISERNGIYIYQFAATADAIEEFQGPQWYELNLDDCLLFSLPLTVFILRPGDVSSTYFVGPRNFVCAAIGKGCVVDRR